MAAAPRWRSRASRRPRAAHNCRRPRAWRARSRHRAAQGMRGGAQIVARGQRPAHSRSKISSSSSSARSPALAILASSLAELRRGEAHLARQGLAVDEGRVQRRRHQLVAVLRRHLDEIAEHVVVPDLQALDAAVVGVARLHRGDHPARGVAQAARLVERRLVALAHEAAVALDQRQLLGQRAPQIRAPARATAGAARPSRRDLLRRLVQLVEPRQRLVGGERCRRAGPRDRAARRGRPTAAPARATCPARRAGWRGCPRAPRHPQQKRRPHPAAARSRAVGQRRGEPLRQQPRAGRRHRAVDGIEQRAAPFAARACASVRDWRGSPDQSPWSHRSLRARAATAAGACRPGCGRYR